MQISKILTVAGQDNEMAVIMGKIKVAGAYRFSLAQKGGSNGWSTITVNYLNT